MNVLKSLLLSLAFSAAAFAGTPVNVNTADAPAIAQAMKGVGLKKAEAIVAYRKEHGAFKSLDQLAGVKGIGLKTVEKNREAITLGGSASAKAQP
jgi:competence protein ComEA